MTLTREVAVVNKGGELHTLPIIRQLSTAELASRDILKGQGD